MEKTEGLTGQLVKQDTQKNKGGLKHGLMKFP